MVAPSWHHQGLVPLVVQEEKKGRKVETMADETMLADVKKALGIEGTFQDETINVYILEVLGFLTSAGVPREKITAGLVSRGVSDLWNYGANNGKLSEYFMRRATQLSY